jgi:hypothetical protein
MTSYYKKSLSKAINSNSDNEFPLALLIDGERRRLLEKHASNRFWQHLYENYRC